MSQDSVFVVPTPRTRLVIADESWGAAIAAFFHDNRAHLEPWGPPMTDQMFDPAFHAKSCVSIAEEWKNGKSAKFLIAPPDEQRVLGTVALFAIERGILQRAMIGYSLAQAAQGHGYMAEAVNATAAYAFGDLELHRVYTTVDVDNPRSHAVLSRCGFEREGLLRSFLLRGGTEWRDHVQYSRING